MWHAEVPFGAARFFRRDKTAILRLLYRHYIWRELQTTSSWQRYNLYKLTYTSTSNSFNALNYLCAAARFARLPGDGSHA